MPEIKEIIETDNLEDKKAKSRFIPLLTLIITLIALILGGGYYVLTQPKGQALLTKAQNALGVKDTPQDSTNLYSKEEQIKALEEALYKKELALEHLANTLEGLQPKNAQENTATKLRYTIKPKTQIITECFAMEIGKWEIPQNCLLAMTMKVDKELQNDNRVVAFEVRGIVDTNPYRGLSPELKQEGLASFRAWSAIRAMNAKIPNAVVFEGPSLQLENKRGYSIKAYFVQ